MAKWMQYMKKADFKQMAEDYGIDPVVARVLVNRGIVEDTDVRKYLHPSEDDFYDAARLKDGEKAASLLAEAIQGKKKIRVIGDYDIDGVFATYILLVGIRRCGGEVDYAIPHRITDGYGLNPSLVQTCVDDGVEVIVTCDNGIAAREAIAVAKEHGLTVVVTDHHSIPYEMEGDEKTYILPEADAIVNPKQEDCAYPFSEICGATVAWKVIDLLYRRFAISKEELFDLIECVAFATVGDVMELVEENRSIVALGLRQLNHTKNIGLKSLITEIELDETEIKAYHIGFRLGPCINATGRLDAAKQAVELLLSDDWTQAREIAANLHRLNEERKEIQRDATERAIEITERDWSEDDLVIVTYVSGIPEGVVGLVASDVKKKYKRPVFILTDAQEEGFLKGSARSVEGFMMYEEMQKCQELFAVYGGHAMAAGLTLPAENLDAFRKAINANTKVTRSDIEEVVHIDVAMPFSYISMELIEQLTQLEPFGTGNPKPVFAQRNVSFFQISRMGADKQYLRARVRDDSGRTLSAVCFDDADGLEELLHQKEQISVIYEPQIHEYREEKSVQLLISDFK